MHPRANKITLIFAPATTFQNAFTPLTLSRHEEYLAGEKEPSIFFLSQEIKEHLRKLNQTAVNLMEYISL